MKEIVFDSNIHNWKKDESEFDDLILNKQNLLFLIETDDNIKFGGFISSKIDGYYNYISDENAFVFTFKDNNPMKFDIEKDKKDQAFFLYEKSSIYQNKYSSFDYQGVENALTGRTGISCFSPKRILVIQMK